MILTGIAFVVFWLLVSLLTVTVETAAAIVGFGFIILGFLMGERNIR